MFHVMNDGKIQIMPQIHYAKLKKIPLAYHIFEGDYSHGSFILNSKFRRYVITKIHDLYDQEAKKDIILNSINNTSIGASINMNIDTNIDTNSVARVEINSDLKWTSSLDPETVIDNKNINNDILDTSDKHNINNNSKLDSISIKREIFGKSIKNN
jgi:hypothetical protein